MVSERFLAALASRMFETSPTAWSGFQVGLGKADEIGLSRSSDLNDVDELNAADAPGYARVAASWSVESTTGGPIARLSIPSLPWHNTSDSDWPEVHLVFVVGSLAGSQGLLIASAVPPFDLKPGDRGGLNEDRLSLTWRAHDYD